MKHEEKVTKKANEVCPVCGSIHYVFTKEYCFACEEREINKYF